MVIIILDDDNVAFQMKYAGDKS